MYSVYVAVIYAYGIDLCSSLCVSVNLCLSLSLTLLLCLYVHMYIYIYIDIYLICISIQIIEYIYIIYTYSLNIIVYIYNMYALFDKHRRWQLTRALMACASGFTDEASNLTCPDIVYLDAA